MRITYLNHINKAAQVAGTLYHQSSTKSLTPQRCFNSCIKAELLLLKENVQKNRVTQSWRTKNKTSTSQRLSVSRVILIMKLHNYPLRKTRINVFSTSNQIKTLIDSLVLHCGHLWSPCFNRKLPLSLGVPRA